MPGHIVVQSVINSTDVARNREIMYAFGDNLMRVGSGPYSGQAHYGRNQPNTVGIPTKNSPHVFMSDAELEANCQAIDIAFDLLETHLSKGGVVVWPESGVGTGRAQLRQRAPQTWVHLCRRMDKLFKYAGKEA